MSDLPPDNQKIEAALVRTMHEHWGLFLGEGIIISLLGLGAMLVPFMAGLATTIFLAWLFLLAGGVGLVASYRGRTAPGFAWALLSAIVALIAGFVLLLYPVQGLVTLTYVLVAYFIADGVLMISLALSHRREMSGRWEWLLLNGVIDLVLAGIILVALPEAAVWVLGLLVGIDLLFGGASLIGMALAARKSAQS
ncbi:MAG: HdeD family acid-resistance protein [Rhizobiales bacterium]|nr:HdeD family acid-resistance protein [Hyphomicrobiales bacterium]